MGSDVTSVASTPDPALAAARKRYRYMPLQENQIRPICTAKSWPWLAEQYGPSWALPFLPQWAAAQVRYYFGRLRQALQRATFRFDKSSSYKQLFSGPLPPFVEQWSDMEAEEYDAAFGWWRIAGANSMVLRCEPDLGALCTRIRLPVEKIEA